MAHWQTAVTRRFAMAWVTILALVLWHPAPAIAQGTKPPAEPARAAAPAASADPGLTEAMRADFGAAVWIPEDACFFSSTLRLKEQWQTVFQSRAMQKLAVLPAVQMALMQLRRSPAFSGFFGPGPKDPFLASLREVAADAVSREVFVYADAKLASFLEAMGSVYFSLFLAGIRLQASPGVGPEPNPFPVVVTAMLARKESLDFPPLVVGFRLEKPERAKTVLLQAVERTRDQLPAAVKEEDIGGVKVHSLTLSYALLPHDRRSEISRELAASGLAPDTVKEFESFLASQTMSFGVGLRGDYLLLSAGPTLGHLRKLGQGGGLAASAAFAPVRRRFRPGPIALSFLDARLTGAGKLPVEETLPIVDTLLALAPSGELPQDLGTRLKKDLRSLLVDINRYLPDARPHLSVSFLNRGLETFSFCAAGSSGLQSDRPLTILARAGAAPLLAVAGRSRPFGEPYARLAHWLRVAYGYFEELAVPRIPASQRPELERFKRLFLPAFKDLHDALRGQLLPALDGCQDLFILDGEGRLAELPGGGAPPLQQPFRFPRPALVVETSEGAKLAQGFARLREIANRLLEGAERELGASRLQIPPPAARDHATGRLYSYGVVPLPGLTIEPHALVAGQVTAWAVAPDQTQALVDSKSGPKDGVIDLAAPAGLAFRLDVAALNRMIFADLGIILALLVEVGQVPPDAAGMIGLHLPEIEKALGALKTYTGRVHEEDGLEVRHSWLHAEDIADE